jgi:hypothetical protein
VAAGTYPPCNTANPSSYRLTVVINSNQYLTRSDNPMQTLLILFVALALSVVLFLSLLALYRGLKKTYEIVNKSQIILLLVSLPIVFVWCFCMSPVLLVLLAAIGYLTGWFRIEDYVNLDS